MMEERIITRHPTGKQGVNINREKYDVVREAILACLAAHGQPTFAELTHDVEARLSGRFDGSIPWYVTTVKLDLEARGVLERVPKSSPQRLRLVKQ